MSRSAPRSHLSKKTEAVTNSAPFHHSLKLMLNMWTLGGGPWRGAGCQYRPRALGLRRGVAGDVVLLLVVVSGSSTVDNVFVVFFCFPIRRCSWQ